MKRLVIAMFVIAALSACSGETEVTIDATSQESLAASTTKIDQSLPEEDRMAFRMAYTQVMARAVLKDGLKQSTPEESLDRVRPHIHGKTGAEIIAMSKQTTDN